MTKKLKVELEVDNTEAKRKAKEVAETAASPAPAAPAPTPAPAPDSGRRATVPAADVPSTVAASTPVEIPIKQPEPVEIPVNEPKPVKIPVEQPKPVKIPVEQPKPVKIPVEQPAPQPAPTVTPVPSSTPSADPSGANARTARAAKDAADGLDKAGRSARNLSNGAEESSRSLKDVARGFAGLGVGMSLKFARQFVEQGSAEDRALGIGESAANLGFMGAKMGGPWGAVIGTAVGTGKGWMESEKAELDRLKAQSEQRAANAETIASWQKARAETLAFKATLDKLTDSETSLADRQQMVAEEIRKREEAEEKLSTTAFRAGTAIDNSTPEKQAKSQEAFAKAMAKYQENAAKLDQLRELQKRLDKEEASDGAASHGAPDALSRVGGYFATGSAGTSLRDLARTGKEQLSVLKKIEAKIGKGATWQ